MPVEVSKRGTAEMEAMFASGDGLPAEPDPEFDLWQMDTSLADYVWLPVRFDGDLPVLDWHDEWRVEDFA